MLQLFKKQTAGTGATQVLVVTRDASTVQAMEMQISQADLSHIQVIEHLHDDALRYLQTGNRPDVIVVELNSIEERDLSGLDALTSARPGDTPVVVISPSIDEEMVRLFLRLKVADWLRKPANPEELVQVCQRVIPAQGTPSEQTTRCFSFIGAHGGAGVTTLAVNAAVMLSEQRVKGRTSNTCLVDLDFSTGMCADFIDAASSLDLKEIAPDPNRLDSQLLDIMLSQYSRTLSLLASRGGLGEFNDIDPSIIARLLDLTAQRFDNIVVDLPRQWFQWTDTVMLGSTASFVVCELTVPGLRAARRLVTEIRDQFGADAAPKVIINKHSRPLIRTGISHKEVEQVLGTAFAGYVGDEGRLIREAIDRGVPVGELKRRNKLLKDLEKILLGK